MAVKRFYGFFLYFVGESKKCWSQLNAERSAEMLFNLLDVDNNGDINEEEFIRSITITMTITTNNGDINEEEFIR